MPRGKQLTAFECGQINAYHKENKSIRQISLLINKSKNVISNYLKDPENHGKKVRSGRPPKLTNRDKRKILRLASNKTISRQQIKNDLNKPVSKWTIGRVLNSSPHLVYKKKKAKPKLTEQHKLNRLQWARERMGWTKKWENIVWSDEKKFNLDGPDGFQYYWHDLRKEEQMFSKRAQGGGSVMVWGTFSWNGKTNLAIVEGRMKVPDYKNMLSTYLVPFGRRIGSRN